MIFKEYIRTLASTLKVSAETVLVQKPSLTMKGKLLH